MLENKEVLNAMEEEGIYIHDVDFTRDYKGVFNKSNLIKYLIYKGCRMQHCKGGRDKNNNKEDSDSDSGSDNDEEEEEEEHYRNITIMDNNKMVGRNCLTFIETTDNGCVRYKFYNKFVQSVESPGVRSVVGNHFMDWCNNPEKELNKAIKESLETGLLRLEITFYRYNTTELLTREFVEDRMEFLEQCIPPDLLYYNPIAKQWELLLQKVSSNICIVDVNSNLAFVVLYTNKETGKTNGFYIKNVTSNKLSNVLKLYTFNTPIIVILLNRDGANINIQQDSYTKMLESVKHPSLRTHNTRVDTSRNPDIFTYTTTGQKYFFAGVASTEEKQPPDAGFKDSYKCMLRIATAKNDVAKKSTTKVNVAFIVFPMDLLEFPQEGESVRKLNKIIQQETKMEKFVETKQEDLNKIAIKNKELEAKQQIAAKRAKIKCNLLNVLSTPIGNIKKIVDVTDNTLLYTFGFKEIKTRYGQQTIIACSESQELTNTTTLAVYWSVSEISRYIEEKKQHWLQIEPNVFGSITSYSIFKFKKMGFCYNTKRNKCAKIQLIAGRRNVEEEETLKTEQIEEISINAKECSKFDTLVRENVISVGDTITITGKRDLAKSVIIRFTHKNKVVNALANYAIKELLKEHGECNKDMPYLACIVGPEKLAKNKTFEYTVLTELPVDEATN
jgi:hypothetical protein